MKYAAIRPSLRWFVSAVLFGFALATASSRAVAASGLVANPSTLEFGAIALGSSEVLPLTITNQGFGPTTITMSINGPSYTVLTTADNTCQGTIAFGQSCVLPVQFKPVAVGFHYDELKLEPSEGTGPSEIDLRGEAAGVGTEMEPPLQFQPLLVGSSEVMTLTIKNLHMPAAATIATSIDDPSYKVLTTAQNTCGAGIARGKSCTLPVQYAPLTPGDHIGTLTLTPSEGSVSTVELRGASESALSTPVPGNIYVLDTNNRRVQFFGPSGKFLGQFGHPSSISPPSGVAVDATNVYLAHDCVVGKYDAIGVLISEFGACGSPDESEGPGFFDINSAVATDSAGNVWVTSPQNGYIQKFDSNGNFLSMFCTVAVTAARVPNCPMETDFDFEPQYITLDSSDNLYVTNQNVAVIDLAITGNFAIVKFAPTGKRIFSLGTVGDIAGQFTPGEPYGIAVDSEGTIYASASTHGCVQMFKKNGSYLGEYSTNRGFGSEPFGLAFDGDGNLVLIEITGLVETYSDGMFVSAFGSYGHGEGQFFQPQGLAVVK